MITKRMKLKMLRAFFVADVRKPLRLSPERWAALLGCIFDEGVGVDEMAALMRQASQNGVELRIRSMCGQRTS